MQSLIETYQRLLKKSVPSYGRRFYDLFVVEGRLTGIVGKRGVGKTTFLIDYLRRNWKNSSQALYVSADNLYFVEHTLLGLVDQFVKEYDGKLLCIDEVRRYANWNQELKNIYDSYPDFQVIFSGSSSIDLIKGSYDLSRRAALSTMHGFSFREYLEVKTQLSFPVLSVQDIVTNAAQISTEISSTPALLGHLHNYWKTGYYPTSLELPDQSACWKRLRSVIDKTIYEDVASFYSIDSKNIESLRKIVYYCATSQPGKISVNRLAQSLDHSSATVSGYIQMLRDTGLLRFLLSDGQGHKLIRNAQKMYVSDSNLAWAVNDQLGKVPSVGVIRELFVISQLQNSDNVVEYSDIGDIKVGKYIFEIGGKNKDTKQIAGTNNAWLLKDDVLIATPQALPLYMLGFLY